MLLISSVGLFHRSVGTTSKRLAVVALSVIFKRVGALRLFAVGCVEVSVAVSTPGSVMVAYKALSFAGAFALVRFEAGAWISVSSSTEVGGVEGLATLRVARFFGVPGSGCGPASACSFALALARDRFGAVGVVSAGS